MIAARFGGIIYEFLLWFGIMLISDVIIMNFYYSTVPVLWYIVGSTFDNTKLSNAFAIQYACISEQSSWPQFVNEYAPRV